MSERDPATGSTLRAGIRWCDPNVFRLRIVMPPQPEPSTAQVIATVTASGSPETVQPGDDNGDQHRSRDPGGSPCGKGIDLSNAVPVTWL